MSEVVGTGCPPDLTADEWLSRLWVRGYNDAISLLSRLVTDDPEHFTNGVTVERRTAYDWVRAVRSKLRAAECREWHIIHGHKG